jgi:regulator of protease activity HflC (stomatin/prohibitin superfamily)
MANDASVQDRPPEAADPAGSTSPAAPEAPPVAVQLTQVRAPLEDAAQVLGTTDAEGRQPIVLVPTRATRIRTDLLFIGLILLAVAFVAEITPALRAAGGTLGVALIAIGVMRGLFVSVPEGAQAVLLQRGRFVNRVGPGVQFVRPGIVVSHIVTTRDTPFDAPSVDVATSDDVRVNVDLLITFRIIAPERFVFGISTSDFDQVLQATCQEAARVLVRSKASTEILDLGDPDTERLRAHVGSRLDPYGVEVVRVVLTHVIPPAQFIASHEARRLATLQRAEEQELHALQVLREADREALTRQQIRARREELELEAENEAGRIERLEALLRRHPSAMHWDFDSERLGVARALAANSRAFLQVGSATDVAGALLMQTHPQQEPSTDDRAAAEGGSTSSPGDTSEVLQAADRGARSNTRTRAPAAS